MPEDFVTKAMRWMRSNRVIAALIVLGLILIALAKATQALEGLYAFFHHVAAPSETEDTIAVLDVTPPADRPLPHVAPVEFRARLHYNLVSTDNAMLLLGVSEYPSSATDCHGTGRPVNEGLTPIRRGAHDTDVRISGRACSSYAVFWASVS